MAPTSTTTGGTGTIYYNERQSYTASCPNGQTGDSVTVVKEAGTVQSVLSVADANAQAQSAAQSEANSRLICEDAGVSYLNVAQTYTANCPAATEDTPAADGNPVTVTIPAGSYSSNVSQQAADDAALAAAQANAEAQLACTYWNEEQTYTAECPTGTAGADVTKTIAAHTFSSTLSQGDANAKALAEAQNTAQAELSCGSTAYMIGNTPQSSMFSLECPGCIRFPIVHASAVVPSNTYQMLTTPANAVADQLSLNQAAKSLAQIQAEANAHAICNLCSLEHNPV